MRLDRNANVNYSTNPDNFFNLPFTGICSFMKTEICPDLARLGPGYDVAVLGMPFDVAASARSGARFGPRGVREASTINCDGLYGMYDPVRDTYYLDKGEKIIDCGDVDVSPCGYEQAFENCTAAVKKILSTGALPVAIGGAHSVTIPVLRAFSGFEDICVVQFDAHLDWTDAYGEFRYSHSSPMRRASEMAHVSKMMQIGLRGLGSSGKKDFEQARAWGSTLVTARDVHEKGAAGVAKLIPQAKNYYITVDIDGLDPSICPGTGSPQAGGLMYQQVSDLMEAVVNKGNLVGFDLVEVAPPYDPCGQTSLYAAQLILDLICYYTKKRPAEKGI